MLTSEEIVARMMANDHFSRWLGIEVKELDSGYCALEMKVRRDMLNGFEIAHGGISYALADSALAFASNSRGRHAVSVESSISHLAPVREGDILRAIAREQHRSHRISLYYIDVYRQDDEKKVAAFKGTVYLKDKVWE